MSDARRSDKTVPAATPAFPALVLRIGDFLSTLCKQVAGAALVIITLICTLNAGSRYLFNHAFSWAEEAMVYLMILVVFAGSASVTWMGLHLKLDLMLRSLPATAQRVIVVATSVGSAALLVLFATQSQRVVERLWRYNQKSEALGIPMWVPQGIVMVGLYLIALMLMLRLLSRDPLPPPVDYTEEEQAL
ncbi:TRAP transporter small permease [Ruixingdingia sedimenti]|uniref:TRAP transporter small permease protein n=1 Tax=Ruixingdingia sedimenti TaxID=3073604 RepID=A0ABU1F942_9RHOB|nr:TRAP transporter small permease subunit [Xinfangfangia sp. LG-4]MDR5653404.1 TRAP transporter small permease subunit [Xinfangfangia sp. LG-4]